MAEPAAPDAPDLRTMATVLACLGAKGLDDDIVAYLGLARQLARHLVNDTQKQRKPA